MRHDDWRKRLVSYLRDNQNRGFRYGQFDCALFAAGAVKAMTGKDLARGYRGYSSLKSGYKKLRSKGHDDHTGPLGVFERVGISKARVGDVVAHDGPLGLALGICGGGFAYVATEQGLGRIPMSACFTAWRVE